MFDSRPGAVEGTFGLSVMPENKYQGMMKTCQGKESQFGRSCHWPNLWQYEH